MTKDLDANKIGLFFFLAIPDENIALSASCSASLAYQNEYDKTPQENRNTLLVRTCAKFYKSLEYKLANRSQIVEQRGLQKLEWPKNIDPGPWREFQKVASKDELSAVIFTTALNFNEVDVGAGLGVTIGTVRYRVSHGLLALGKLIRL